MNDASGARSTRLIRSRWSAGVLSGLLAGAVMAMAMMAYMAATGRSVWTNPNLISAMWFGPEAADGAFGMKTIVGFVTHMVTSGLMGWIAIPFIRDVPKGRMVLLGIAYAVASYPIVFSGVITWANPLMIERTSLMPMTLGHVLFGIVLGLGFSHFEGRRMTAIR
jgi:hypothetical protein